MAARSILFPLKHILIAVLLLAWIPPAQAAPLPAVGWAAPTLPVVTLESNRPYAHLGFSVDAAGDVNGDGYDDVIVGAPDFNQDQNNEGAAYIFHGSAAGLSTTPAAILQSNQAGALLGSSVAGAGDINGDGYDDVIAGARSYNGGQANEGAVFVFTGSAGGVSTTPAVILRSNQAGALLGSSVAGAGSVNGDLYADIIAGAPGYKNGQDYEGAIYVYYGSNSGLNSVPSTIIESNISGAYLGESVAGAGDVNHDTFDDIVAGLYRYASRGAIFIYHGSASGPGATYDTMLLGSQSGASLGASVAGAGDVNDDGFDDIIAGAPRYDNGQSNEGAAFVYHGSAGGVSATPNAILESNLASANLGWSVGGAGSINGDNYADVIAGANLYTNIIKNEGAAFIFFSAPSGVQPQYPLVIDSNQLEARLGQSVAGAGDVNGDGFADIIAGAPYYTNGHTEEGVAFVYYGAGGSTWIYLPAVVNRAQ